MARFYTNENIPLPVVTELRRMGHDVLTSYDAGRATGIVLCTADPDFGDLALRIHQAVEGLSDSSGQLLRVNRPG